MYIVLLSDVLIQEAPNSASSSRVSPTASTRDAFRLSRRRGFESKTVFVASVCKTLGIVRAKGKLWVLRAAPESVALGSGTNNVSTPSVAHGAPERPAERL